MSVAAKRVLQYWSLEAASRLFHVFGLNVVVVVVVVVVVGRSQAGADAFQYCPSQPRTVPPLRIRFPEQKNLAKAPSRSYSKWP